MLNFFQEDGSTSCLQNQCDIRLDLWQTILNFTLTSSEAENAPTDLTKSMVDDFKKGKVARHNTVHADLHHQRLQGK